MSARALASLLAATAVAGGCVTMGPDYQRPELAVPAGYSVAASGGEIPDAWWRSFGSGELDALVAEALAANADLAAAAARVEEARALAGEARADRLPQLDGRLAKTRTKLSSDTATVPPGFDLQRDAHRAALSFSWELDFWGRLARATEAARAGLVASEEGHRAIRLGVVAETATTYFHLLSLDRQLAIARETLSTRFESVRLQRLRFDAGSISELDLSQAEAELAATEATVPALERQIARAEGRLAVLLGRIGRVDPRGGELAALAVPEVPVGLPSELLQRRPDVVAAEQALVAANARIGVARAELFPSLSLTAYGGSESRELGDLLTSGTSIWQVGANLLQPIFAGGRARRRVEGARARESEALAGYARAVQSAFADVEVALAERRTAAAEREALDRQVTALARARHLATLRYDAGDASYLDVLDAERSLFRAELELVGARQLEAESAVALYRALGGGWPEAPAPEG